MSNKPKIRRRLRCPNCGSLDVIKWGVRNGCQRHKCNNCHSLFSSRRKDISKSNRFSWFRKWVLGRMTINDISEVSGYSSRQLLRWFEEYLEELSDLAYKHISPYISAGRWHVLFWWSLFDCLPGSQPETHCLLPFHNVRGWRWDCFRPDKYKGARIQCGRYHNRWRRPDNTRCRVCIP